MREVLAERRAAFPSSGEVNFRVTDVQAAVRAVAAIYAPLAETHDHLDGLSLSFGTWRLNLRASNTEPLLRLNVEARGRADLVADKLAQLTAVIRRQPV